MISTGWTRCGRGQLSPYQLAASPNAGLQARSLAGRGSHCRYARSDSAIARDRTGFASSWLSPKYRTAIVDIKTTGNSGSGVFDANKKCLLGIITAIIHDNKIEQENGQPVEKKREVAKYFVPAPAIAEFIPPEDRF